MIKTIEQQITENPDVVVVEGTAVVVVVVDSVVVVEVVVVVVGIEVVAVVIGLVGLVDIGIRLFEFVAKTQFL